MRSLPLALLVLALASPASAAAHAPAPAKAARTAAPVLPWIQDDYPKAVALAKARRLPIFVEAWAPW